MGAAGSVGPEDEHGDGTTAPPDTAPPDTAPPDTAPRPLQAACAVLGLEVLALVGLAVFLVIDTLTGAAESIGGALLGALLVLLCAAAIGFGARGLLRCRSSARTPIVVIQLLAIPVSYSLGFQAGRVSIGGPMLAAALAVLYLLFTPPSRAALDRDLAD